MKVNYDFKKKQVGVEANVEKIIEKGIDNREKNWEERIAAKKEILQLKHQQKMELKNNKANKKTKYELKLEEQKRQEKLHRQHEIKKQKNIIRNISIVLIFLFAMFCSVGFKDGYILAPIISIIQIILLIISILMCEDLFHIFRKDYKVFFIFSIILIVVWLVFAV